MILYNDREKLRNAGFEAPPESTQCIAFLLHDLIHKTSYDGESSLKSTTGMV
jgi:hypothetical protein